MCCPWMPQFSYTRLKFSVIVKQQNVNVRAINIFKNKKGFPAGEFTKVGIILAQDWPNENIV